MKMAHLGFHVAAVAAVLATAGSAQAFNEIRNRSYGDTYGNGRLGGTLLYQAKQSNVGRVSTGFNIPFLTSNVPLLTTEPTKLLSSTASQGFEASATVLNHKFTAFAFRSSASGSWRNPLTSTGSGTYRETASTTSTVLGQETFGTTTPCGSNDNSTCSTHNVATFSGETDDVEAEFWVVIGLVPMRFEVLGRLMYSAGLDLNSRALAMKYLGLKETLFARVSANASVSATLTGRFQVCPVDCSVTGKVVYVDLLSADVTPTTSSSMGAVWNSNATYAWENRGPATLSVLDGSFAVSLGSTEYDIVDWKGYSWTKDLWSNSGKRTCEDFASDLSKCDSIVED